jgi:hypothetical protein
MLWNRSLVMLDSETESLWSHILGEAMRGPLQGTILETLPSDLVTWGAWKQAHPKTTVLDLSRTARGFTSDFYKQPDRFVLGFQVDDDFYHVSFATLQKQHLIQTGLGGQPLIIIFDPKSTSARIYSRRIADRVLSFRADEDNLTDLPTNSEWKRATATATAGPMRGKQLSQRVGLVSFTVAWRTFHPNSKEVPGSSQAAIDQLVPSREP